MSMTGIGTGVGLVTVAEMCRGVRSAVAFPQLASVPLTINRVRPNRRNRWVSFVCSGASRSVWKVRVRVCERIGSVISKGSTTPVGCTRTVVVPFRLTCEAHHSGIASLFAEVVTLTTVSLATRKSHSLLSTVSDPYIIKRGSVFEIEHRFGEIEQSGVIDSDLRFDLGSVLSVRDQSL